MPLHRVRISLSGDWTPGYVEGLACVRGAHVELYTTERLQFVNALPIPQLVEWLEVGWTDDEGLNVMQKHLAPVEMDVGGVVDVKTLSWCG